MFAAKQWRRSSGFHTATLVITLVAVLTTGWLVVNRQSVVDQLAVWQYTPSAAVTSLAERADMSSGGRFLFYASQPAIEDSRTFNQSCTRKEQSTAILGCYDGRRIYVYDVTNEQLDGIKEVTAAHEMLHAAYQRLTPGEKSRVDKLLEVEYERIKDNKNVAERVAFYARVEPGERDNELHSVIGTEVANISPELEAHYKKYFTNRQAVVSLHAKYDAVFTSIQARSDALSSQVGTLGEKIEKGSRAYNASVAQLNQDIAGFNSRAANNDFSTRYEFDNARASLVARANELTATRDQLNDDVAAYSALRDELSQLAIQSEELNHSIDSTLSPAPSV